MGVTGLNTPVLKGGNHALRDYRCINTMPMHSRVLVAPGFEPSILLIRVNDTVRSPVGSHLQARPPYSDKPPEYGNCRVAVIK